MLRVETLIKKLCKESGITYTEGKRFLNKKQLNELIIYLQTLKEQIDAKS